MGTNNVLSHLNRSFFDLVVLIAFLIVFTASKSSGVALALGHGEPPNPYSKIKQRSNTDEAKPNYLSKNYSNYRGLSKRNKHETTVSAENKRVGATRKHVGVTINIFEFISQKDIQILFITLN